MQDLTARGLLIFDDDDDFVGFRSLRALGIYGMDH